MNFGCHHLIGFVALSLVAANAHAQEPNSRRTITIHTDDVIAPSNAQTLTERLAQVDAAIRCRIVRSQVKVVHEDVPPGVDPIYGNHPETEHTVLVLETLKDSNRLPVVGFTTTVVEPSGTALVDGVRIVKDADKFRTFMPGEEHVLFLKWDAAHSQFAVPGPADAFLLDRGTVTTSGHAPFSMEQRGMPVTDFLARVRSAVAALPRP